jgi:hypothetical protein
VSVVGEKAPVLPAATAMWSEEGIGLLVFHTRVML